MSKAGFCCFGSKKKKQASVAKKRPLLALFFSLLFSFLLPFCFVSLLPYVFLFLFYVIIFICLSFLLFFGFSYFYFTLMVFYFIYTFNFDISRDTYDVPYMWYVMFSDIYFCLFTLYLSIRCSKMYYGIFTKYRRDVQ